MMKLRLPKSLRRREYPIQRDKYGLTLRRSAFMLFHQQMRPGEVKNHLKERFPEIKPNTIYRYFQQYQKLPKNFQDRYSMIQFMKKDPSLFNTMVEAISESRGMSQEDIILLLQQPWGLHRLLRDLWPNLLKREEEKQKRQEAKSHRVITNIIGLALASGTTLEELTNIVEEIWDKAIKKKTSQAADIDQTGFYPV